MNNAALIKEIKKLKKEKNAVILAHLYQIPDIQDLADFVGDSLDLSRKASTTDADIIVFCGVRFMAETAKILSPQKMVLAPERFAGCPMADMVTARDVERLREQHPDGAVVCYINSPASVKAVSDICCTSSNAVAVVKSLKQKKIIFLPDRNLGHYISRFFEDRTFVLFDGFCPVHDQITLEMAQAAKEAYPDAKMLVHPECRPEVVDLADFVGSTTKIINAAGQFDARTLIIGTEEGVLHPLRRAYPEKQFVSLHAPFVCPDMKRTTLESVHMALTHLQYRIELDQAVMDAASVSLNRMLAL